MGADPDTVSAHRLELLGIVGFLERKEDGDPPVPGIQGIVGVLGLPVGVSPDLQEALVPAGPPDTSTRRAALARSTESSQLE